MAEYFDAVLEHGRSIEQVFAAVWATLCDPFMTAEADNQQLRVFGGEADHKEGTSSGLLSSPATGIDAYGNHEMYDEAIDEESWYLNDVVSTSGGAAAVGTCKVDASCMKVLEARRLPSLRAPDNNSDRLSELTDVLEPVDSSSNLASSSGASVLFSPNVLLRTNLLKSRRILHVQESELSGEPQKALARCAELEWSLNLSKPWLQELEGTSQN